jgi:hypothetical protein
MHNTSRIVFLFHFPCISMPFVEIEIFRFVSSALRQTEGQAKSVWKVHELIHDLFHLQDSRSDLNWCVWRWAEYVYFIVMDNLCDS